MKESGFNMESRERMIPLCRLKRGEIWEDPVNGHRIGVLDASEREDVLQLADTARFGLFINDPPYNLSRPGKADSAFPRVELEDYLEFSKKWVSNCLSVSHEDAHFYIWMGLDYRDGFRPLPEFMLMMRDFTELEPRNVITMKNQRGYGTQKNWMWVRQELLYYVRGSPSFYPVYTDIPKTLKGYYKLVAGIRTENLDRGRGSTLRAGNVWSDIQQVFYRLEENVPGCYAQKPLKAIQRIIRTCGDSPVLDLFAHSGTTLIAGELDGRRVYTMDKDPIFVEIAIRRLERFRSTSKTGWQRVSPFPELQEEA